MTTSPSYIKSYVLVADAWRAKLYRHSPTGTALELIYDQVNFCGGRRRSGTPGKPSSREGHIADNTLPALTPKATEDMEDFARDLGKKLQQECKAGNFDKLLIAAPAYFLAILKAHCEACTHIDLSLKALDLVQSSPEDILAAINYQQYR